MYARGAAASGRLAVTRRFGASDDVVGALPEVAYVVRDVRTDAARLTAYQHLLGEAATDALPAGFVHVLAFPVATALMTRSDFPLPLLGMVHLANTVTQHRAIRLGEPLDVRAWAQDLRPHRAGTQVDLVTEVSAADEVVWRGTSTYLAKGTSATGTASTSTDDEREAFVAPVPTGQWRLPADTGRRYAAVSGDRNPIHLSALSAKALGFPRAIAHGMYTASRALADVGAARGEAFVWTADFSKPVLLPSTPNVRIGHDADGFAYTVWRPGAQAPHLTGTVTPA
nr:MaoC/PaaZ C-terminal domain-containing protein [Cellulomonas sp. JH27-2]